MKEVRTETRQMISAVSAVTTAPSASVNQSIVLNFPCSEWARAAGEEMSTAFGDATEPERQEDQIQEYMNQNALDSNYALARMRMDIESELRKILDKRPYTEDPSRMSGRNMSARMLFRTLVKMKPEFQHMRSSFDYVLEVCNAAIHGQRISEGTANEAVGKGLKMLRELRRENDL